MIPKVRTFRVRFRPCGDTGNKVSYYDCETIEIHYHSHQGDALNLNHAIHFLSDLGFQVMNQFEYKGDVFLITNSIIT